MNRNRKSGELFSMSFLDVICCGFGAVVLLVLLAKTDIVGSAPDLEHVKNLLIRQVAEKENKIAAEAERSRLAAQIRLLKANIDRLAVPNPEHGKLQRQLATQQAAEKILQIQTDAPTPTVRKQAATDSTVQVGGIPVDSDHIIFIVDTSGSMQQQWPRVLRELENVLDIHPQVSGFQVMNDNGVYLLKAYAGRWIPDTPGRRKSVLSLMQTWRSLSNSSPVEGLQTALRTYAKRTDNLAIYIFGDDYTGGSYDPVLNTIEQLNTDAAGQPIARIHGIGFHGSYTGTEHRFATLIREVARRNRGAFVALGQ